MKIIKFCAKLLCFLLLTTFIFMIPNMIIVYNSESFEESLLCWSMMFFVYSFLIAMDCAASIIFKVNNDTV